MRRVAFVGVALLAATGLPARGAAYDVVSGFATMSDGVKLEATVTLPAGTPSGAELPLVVRHHGGGSNKDNDYDTKYGRKFVDTGSYALLMYSHRGHGGSEGTFDFFGTRTTKDFSEVLDWVEATLGAKVNTQIVGVSGHSQGGGESLLPAAFDERVKAVAVGNTFSSLNRALNPNDCFKFSFATGIFALAYKQSLSRTDDARALRWGAQLYTETQAVAIPTGEVDEDGNVVVASTEGELALRSPLTYAHRLVSLGSRGPVPVYWTQSWEDALFPGDHALEFMDLLREEGMPEEMMHLWFSSGGHEAGPNDPDDEAGKEAAMIAWFDRWLRGVQNGADAWPAVDYAQRSGAGWVHKTANSWPVSVGERSFFPAFGGRLEPAAYMDPPGVAAVIANDVASANIGTEPILTNRVANDHPEMRPLWRSIPDGANPVDTATFTGPPLTASLEFTGAPRVQLSLTSSARTFLQINAKLWDVAPDGSRTLVTRGCAAMAFDGGRLELWPNSHVFAKDHRVQLTISNTDFPTFRPDLEPSVTLIRSGTKLTLAGVA